MLQAIKRLKKGCDKKIVTRLKRLWSKKDWKRLW